MGVLSTVSNWFRPRAQSGDSSDLLTPAQWLSTALSGYLSRANVLFSPQTALTLSTYYACIRNISEDVGKLPLFTYKRVDERTRERAFDHPLYALLHDSPNPDMTAFTFRQLLTQDVLGWGNGYAWIEREIQLGRRPIRAVKALWPLHPSRVRKRRIEGEVVYDITSASTQSNLETTLEVTTIPQADMLHLVGLTHDGQEGMSVLNYAADSLGIALSAQDYGNAFFRNSAQPSGILSHPKTLSAAAQERLRADWKARFGSTGTQQDIAVLEEGMAFTPITIPNNQAQFLETRQFQVREICRWFRMPPHKVADLADAHYTNIEQMALEYVTDTLMPWLIRWEQTMKMRLFAPMSSPYYAEHNVMGLLRGDSRARAMFYKDLFGLGAITPNEIRSYENENPLGPDGDESFISANNYRTLKSAVQMSTEPMAPVTGSRNGVAPVPGGRNGATPHDDDADDEEEDD